MSIDRPDHGTSGADHEEQALQDLLQFPFVDALFGRRSRRFFRGAEIPDGPLAYKSRHEPIPLTELEKLLILTATGGNTGWHHSITRHARYAPHLSNYPGAAGGRTFPSAAGFHTSEIFFTDDSGTYIFTTRDAPALVQREEDGSLSRNMPSPTSASSRKTASASMTT